MTPEKTSKSPKIFVLDTNVLLHDPDALNSFGNNEVVIPLTVIRELNKKRKGTDEIAFSAREAFRKIRELRRTGKISEGVKLPGGGILKTVATTKVYKGLKEKENDDLIISSALKIKEDNKGREVILVTKDEAASIKAETVGLQVQDYEKDKTSEFQKYGRVLTEGDNENGILSTRYILKGEHLVRLFDKDHAQQIKEKEALFFGSINPRNIEQKCAMDALTNPDVEVVALTGNAGSGKTLLALAAALQQTTKRDPLFQQVLVARPVVPMGGRDNDLGFLPGDINEKLKPWMQPIFDNLEVLIKTPKESKDRMASGKYRGYQYLIDDETLRIKPLAYIRGRSLPNRYFIIDEAQNLRPLDVKTIVTRCGDGTKIVFTGDLAQIDTPYLDRESNGLAYLISRYINEPEFCYLHMGKSARSPMADKAARLL